LEKDVMVSHDDGFGLDDWIFLKIIKDS
jgi:hypothetical protein